MTDTLVGAADQIKSNNTQTQSLQDILDGLDIGPTKSAMDYLEQIENIQSEQEKVSEMISEARKLQDQAKSGDKSVKMSDEMIAYFKSAGLNVKDLSGSKDYKAQKLILEQIQNGTGAADVYIRKAGSKEAAIAEAQKQLDDIAYTFDSDEWTFNIESLTNYQESISNKTQTLMVFLQDFISQYNSYLQGANSAIQEAAQVQTSILTGR